MDSTIPRGKWMATLQAFTNRNAGRTAILEVDGQDIGAQQAGRDYPLRGIAYDPRDNRVEIMLGDQASVDRRVTHTIVTPGEIDLLQGVDGRDRALRISHEAGHTMLSFEADDG